MDKIMKARVQHKHDIEAHWKLATNFIPLASEIIVYDQDENNIYPRIKVGNGKDNINDLPFASASVVVDTEPPADTSVVWVDPDDDFREEYSDVVDSIMSEYGKMYSSFPSDEEILAMPNRNYFNVRTTLEGEVKFVPYYRTTSWKPSSLKYVGGNGQTVYVIPLNQPPGEIYLPNYGLKPGEENAENNSLVIEKVLELAPYGATLRFPVGRFFFARPINTTKHIQIIGTLESVHYDEALTGTTILKFPNLNNDDAAITLEQGSISNLTVAGNPSQYDYRIERKEDGDGSTPPEVNVIQTGPIWAYGIKGGSTLKIHNVTVRNFYYGIWCSTGNVSITNVICRHCHYGLSIANDTKVMNLFGADNAILLQIRGSLSSAIGLRCDNAGEHLVEIINSCSSITLADLDGEFCLGSIIAVGNNTATSNLKSLQVTGAHGRSGVKHYYHKNDSEINAKNVTADTAAEYGVITIKRGSTLDGAIITTNQRQNGNSPFDNDNEKVYVVPYVLLTADTSTVAKNVQFFVTGDAEGESLTDWAEKRIVSFSELENACTTKVQTYSGYVKYIKSGATTTIIDDATDLYQRMNLNK